MKNVMVDLETLGVTADAVIMSIGAVRFDLNGGIDEKEAFYASVSIDSNVVLGRRVAESTLNWWMTQAPEPAKRVFTEPKQTLESALQDFAEWFGDEDTLIWSNGASFDIPMMEHAYMQLQMESPWKFYNSRCMRTYKTLPGAERASKPKTEHHALLDAIDQAKYVQAVHREVFGKKEKVAA